MEFPVTNFNAARHVKAKLESSADAISVGEGLEEATFWFAGSNPIEIPGLAASASAKSPSDSTSVALTVEVKATLPGSDFEAQ